MSVAETAGSAVVVAGISAATAPVLIIIGAGALIEMGLNYGIGRLKEYLFD